MLDISRRLFIAGAVAIAVRPAVAREAAAPAAMVVHKDPNCGCCSGWVAHMRSAGFTAKVIESGDLAPIKQRLGVPERLASCHTAEIDGYVIEGHVPAHAVKRLLAERPKAIGLAVPGMPIGSPGMEVRGSPDERYAVVLFGPSGERVYGHYKGAREA